MQALGTARCHGALRVVIVICISIVDGNPDGAMLSRMTPCPDPAGAAMSAVPPSPPRAWAEIDLDALRHNAREAARIGGAPVMAVVKAGAYGHGLEEVVGALTPLSEVAFFGVANVGEARRVASTGSPTPIYLLGATVESERTEITARGWVPCLSSVDEACHFAALGASLGRPVTAHLAVDTGMGRGGFLPTDLPGVWPIISNLPGLTIDGIGSHLPSADEDPAFTRAQIQTFGEVIEALGGPSVFRWRHLLNSAGLAGYRAPACNLTRPGLLLYGYCTLPDSSPPVRPVMTLKSRITLVRTLPPGHGVSYGRAFVTERETRVATVGIGYGDGYPRHLSGTGAHVIVRGRAVPLLGRVTMDQIMIDVTDVPDAATGDIVGVFGPAVPVSTLAGLAGTIPWEMLTRITARVARFHG